MNKLKVFKNVFGKRTESGFSVKNLGTVLLLLLLVPYIITSLFGNASGGNTVQEKERMLEEQLREGGLFVINQTALGREEIPLEIYVADVLARTMEPGYEAEALKAQAVLIRTNLVPEGDEDIAVADEEYGNGGVRAECLRAVSETRGIYLEYEGKPVYGAYFLVSNGNTREAGEVLGTGTYPYLTQVSCEKDYLSDQYLHRVEYSLEGFEKIWERTGEKSDAEIEKALGEEEGEEMAGMIVLRDSAGYGRYLRYGEKWVSCEELRYALCLPSSDFEIKSDAGRLIFTVKGSGHGLGMSQFGANELALEGWDYGKILNYFFQGVSFTKME